MKESSKAMADFEREVFGEPSQSSLRNVDWNSFHHKRAIAAILVRAVHTMELDRKQNRQGRQAQARPWYKFFNFKVHEKLVDKSSGSYFGAIFEFKDPHYHFSGQRPPRYVIAFRGSIKTSIKDLKVDVHCILNNLENSNRFKEGLQSVQEIVLANNTHPRNIWLAGHSIGSSIALLIGKHLVEQRRVNLQTYLFNPPFISPPIEWIKNDEWRKNVRFINSLLIHYLTIMVKGRQIAQDDSAFVTLSSWTPYLFINPSDFICSEYTGYFEHREYMKSIGSYGEKIGRIAARHCVGDLLQSVRGKDYGPMHLIPSADVVVNLSPCQSQSPSFKEAHGIRQWWRQDLELKCRPYRYKS